MTQELPEPLLPPDVDVREFPDLPIAIQRFAQSELISTRSDAEIVAAMQLWLASFHQVPSSSLPASDLELCRLAGYGKTVREFLRVKDGAMHGLIRCSDGRYWHPVVAEKSAHAWNKKLSERHRKAVDRARKFNDERKARGESPLPIPRQPFRLVEDEHSEVRRWHYVNEDGKRVDGRFRVSDGIPMESSATATTEFQNGREDYPSAIQKEKKRKEKEGEEKPARKVRATPIPPDFAISDRVREWAADKGYDRLEQRFEQFVGYAKRGGKTYIDWDEALMSAIRENWAKLSGNGADSLSPAGRQTAENVQRWLEETSDGPTN